MEAGQKKQAKRTAKITNELVKTTPLATGQPFNIYDTELRGFCLRVTRTNKSYGVRIKVGGKEVYRSIAAIGRTGCPDTATRARDRAKALIGELVKGIDTKADEKTKKRAEREAAKAKNVEPEVLTLASALESYIAVAINLKQDKPISERTKSDYRYIMTHELKEWANIPLESIDRKMADAMRIKIVQERGATRAVHGMRLVRTLCRKYKVGLLDWENFFPKSTVRTTELEPDDGKILFEALSEMTHHSSSSRYVMALLLTGCRRKELADVLVSDVGQDGRTITLRETKNGNKHVIQCSTQLREIVKGLMVDSDGDKRQGDFKLFGKCGDPRKTLINCNKVVKDAANAASEANGTAILDKSFSLHDLRKLCAITLNKLRFPHATIQAVLNHTPAASDVTSACYIKVSEEERRLAWQALADYYSETKATVIQLPTARAA